jgi:hypothetical protein
VWATALLCCSFERERVVSATTLSRKYHPLCYLLDALPLQFLRFMNRDHQEKLARVNAWLRSTFDGDRVPTFQATDENIERLYALCCACEQV